MLQDLDQIKEETRTIKSIKFMNIGKTWRTKIQDGENGLPNLRPILTLYKQTLKL